MYKDNNNFYKQNINIILLINFIFIIYIYIYRIFL